MFGVPTIIIMRVDDNTQEKILTQQEQAEKFLREQQEHDRGWYNETTANHLSRAKDGRFWEK